MMLPLRNKFIVPIALCLLMTQGLWPGQMMGEVAEGEEEAISEELLAEQEELLRLRQQNLDLQLELVELQENIAIAKQQAIEAQFGLNDDISSPLRMQSGLSSGTDADPTIIGGQQTPVQSKIRTIEASKRAVRSIVDNLKDLKDIKSLVIYNQEDYGKLKFYLFYENYRQNLIDSYDYELERFQDLISPNQDNSSSGSDNGDRGFDPLGSISGGLSPSPLMSSKVAMRSMVELLSFFRANDQLAYNEYRPGRNAEDINFLTAQLVGNLADERREDIKVYAPSLYWVDLPRSQGFLLSQNQNMFNQLLRDMGDLREARQEAEAILANPAPAPWNVPPGRIEQVVSNLEELNQKALDLEAFLDGETQQFFEQNQNQDSTSPSQPLPQQPTPEEQQELLMFTLVEGAQIAEVLQEDGSHALILEVLASGGSQRIRQSLWTSIFTGNGISFSGAIAVQYFLLDRDNSIKAADVVSFDTGF